MALIQSIVYKPTRSSTADAVYTRVSVQTAMLIENYGIEGDRKGGNPRRNLNVMDDRTLAELHMEGYPIEPGALGENLIISGLDLRTLPPQARLRIGDSAIIELGKPRIPCHKLTRIDERMPNAVGERVGVMCRVAQSGRIAVGDRVEVIAALVNESSR